MIKRIIFSILIISAFACTANADILPVSTKDITPQSIGMYQMPSRIVVYSEPNTKSNILYEANWDNRTFNSSNGGYEKIFSVFVQNKELAYVQVTDFTDDWIEIIYDKNTQKRGWIQAEDLRFMQWRNFYNVYGRKYGLKIFSDAPQYVKDLHSSTSDESQTVQTIKKPLKIKLTVIKGNWALITAIENNIGNTGYIRWRSNDGKIFAFPAIK